VIKVLALNPFTNIRGSSISIKAIAGNPLHLGSGEVWLKGDVNSVLRSLVELPIFGTAVVNKGTWDQAYKLGGMSSASYKQPLTPSKTPTPIQIVSGRDGRIYAAIPTSATEVRLTALTGGNTALGGRPDFSGAAKAFFNAVNTGRLDRDQVGLSSKISMQGIGQNPLSPTASLLQDSIASLRTGTGKLGPGYLLGDPLTGVTRYREALLASVKGDLTKLTAEERMLVAKAINFESQDQLNKRLDALNFSQPSTVTALRTKVAEYDQLLDKLSKMDLAIAREKFPTSYAKAVIDEAAILTTVKLDTPNLNDPQSRAKFVNQYSNGAMPDELRNAIAGATLTNAAGTLGFRFVVGAVEKKAPALLGGPFGYVLAGAGTVMTLTEGLEIADSIKKYFALDAKIMNPKSQFNARELAAAARELTVLKCEIASKLIGMTYNVADLAITAKASARANKLRDAGNTGKPITVRPSSTSGSTAATPSKPKNPGATAEAPNTPVPEVSGLPKVKRSTIPKVTALPGVNNIVPFERFGGTSLVLAGNTPNPNKPGAAELYAALEVATGKAGNPDTIKLLLSAQKAPADPKSVIQIDSNTVIALDPKRAGHGLLATTGPGQKIVSTPIMVSMVGRQMVIKLSAGKAKPTTATSAQSGAQGGAQGNDQSTGGAAKPSKKTTSAAGSDGASGGGAVPPGGKRRTSAASPDPEDKSNRHPTSGLNAAMLSPELRILFQINQLKAENLTMEGFRNLLADTGCRGPTTSMLLLAKWIKQRKPQWLVTDEQLKRPSLLGKEVAEILSAGEKGRIPKTLIELAEARKWIRFNRNQLSTEISSALKKVLVNLNPSPQKVLELGSGNGFGSEAVLNAFPKASVIAVDLDTDALARLRTRAGPNKHRLSTQTMSAVELRYPTNVDLVIAERLFPHLDEQSLEKVLEKTQVALNSNGILVCDFYTTDHLNAKSRGAFYRGEKAIRELVLKHFFIVSESNDSGLMSLILKPKK
jgi:precorrin-6B methylase 2